MEVFKKIKTKLPQGTSDMVTYALGQVVPRAKVARAPKVRRPLEAYLGALMVFDLNKGNVAWVAARVKGVQKIEGFAEEFVRACVRVSYEGRYGAAECAAKVIKKVTSLKGKGRDHQRRATPAEEVGVRVIDR